MKRIVLKTVVCVLLTALVVVLGASFYMLNYALAPDDDRSDTQHYFTKQFDRYPEVRPWYDSIVQCGALHDTMVMMPRGERHHAYFIKNNSRRTALLIHGWRNCAIEMFFIARIYDSLGCNVVIPDLHAHGLSEGDAVGMGWQDRHDMMHWLSLFKTDSIVVHGLSMGAATAMMMSAESMPEGVVDARFVEDCGYTDVWSEFASELKAQFGLPEFPLLHATSLLCKWRYGWSFKEASSLNQVAKSRWPMLFIHGGADTFVPIEMVYRLERAKPEPKRLWVPPDVPHAKSFMFFSEDYVRHVVDFLTFPPGECIKGGE